MSLQQKLRRYRKKPSVGWDELEPKLEEFDTKMREAEAEPHEGKRKTEALWPIFRIHHQRSRYIFDLFWKEEKISRELYQFCLDAKIVDSQLMAKWNTKTRADISILFNAITMAKVFENRYRYLILATGCLGLTSISSNMLAFNIAQVCMGSEYFDHTNQTSSISVPLDYTPYEVSLINWAVALGTAISTLPFSEAYVRLGAKWPFLVAGLLSVFATALIPLAAEFHFYALLAFRLLQICKSSYGWPMVFYVHAISGFLVFVLWFLVYYDKPQDTQKVSPIELEKIQRNKNRDQIDGTKKIPYKVQIPVRLICGEMSDRITFLSENLKLIVFNTITVGGAGIAYASIGFMPIELPIWPIVGFCVVNISTGAASGGFYKAAVLQYSHFVIATCQFLKCITLFLGPALVAIFVHDAGLQSEWRVVFLITAAFLSMEYRIPMPLTLDEYQRGQLFSVSEASKNETGGGEGVEEPFNSTTLCPGQTLSGMYTYKIYRVRSKVPWFFRKMLPEVAMVLVEESWNAFPYCKTVLSNPGYMALGLNEEKLRQREVVFLDILDPAPLKPTDLTPETDPSVFVSTKTNRGPLQSGWNSGGTTEIMCCYKLVTTQFKWFGMQTRAEKSIHRNYPRLFIKFHRQVVNTIKAILFVFSEIWCWQDRWYGLSMADIRKIEAETAKQLREQRASGPVRGMAAEEQ
ncbi:Phosphatidylinositol transfer protein alpha isoform [Aphelenchoides besseyi]|nr:Phosphatidylinositol transfer protein alpha isoform [Aphelenchoides besseyi]